MQNELILLHITTQVLSANSSIDITDANGRAIMDFMLHTLSLLLCFKYD